MTNISGKRTTIFGLLTKKEQKAYIKFYINALIVLLNIKWIVKTIAFSVSNVGKNMKWMNLVNSMQQQKTEFSHIPDWYEWEREEVRKEILAGQYLIEDDVIVDSLPNAKGFIPLGDGHLKHDSNGFVLNYEIKGEKKTLVKDVASMYGCHIELEYNGKGDAIDLSTLDDTFHVYFKNLKNVVTKIHFATEELYKIKKEQGPN